MGSRVAILDLPTSEGEKVAREIAESTQGKCIFTPADVIILYVSNIYFYMHRSIAGYNPYNLFILTKDYSKNFTTS